jgi:hypothetical protein
MEEIPFRSARDARAFLLPRDGAGASSGHAGRQ